MSIVAALVCLLATTAGWASPVADDSAEVDIQSLGKAWQGSEGIAGEGAVSAGRATGSDVAARWDIRDSYGDQSADRAGVAGAGGIKDRAQFAEGFKKQATLVGKDSGYSDTGYRTVEGSVDYGRATAFQDKARNAGIATSAGQSKAHVLDADQATYAKAAQEGRVSGGVKQAGQAHQAARADAGLAAANRGAAGRAGWGVGQAAQWDRPIAKLGPSQLLGLRQPWGYDNVQAQRPSWNFQRSTGPGAPQQTGWGVGRLGSGSLSGLGWRGQSGWFSG